MAAVPTDPAADRPAIEVRHKGLLTLSVMGAALMQVLDQTIANVALPHMQASLGATQDSVSWVLTSYIVATAIVMPATGWLTNRFGVRNLFLASTVMFIVASGLCGMAQNIGQMVVFRLLQGLGGACIMPLTQTLMFDINRPSDHPRALSLYGMSIMVGPILGPMMGGWLTDNLDWRWIFYINVPLGGLALVGLWMFLPHHRQPPIRFDWKGWLLIALALGAFQLMLDRGQHEDWFASTEIWIEAGVAVAALWVFAVHLFTSPNPLFPLVLLKDRNLLSGTAFMFVLGLVMTASVALLPSMLQTLFGYSVTGSGELMASRGVGTIISMALAARLMTWLGARLVIMIGLLIGAFALWMMTGWSLDMDWHAPVYSGFVQGLGFGLTFTPISVIAFSTLPVRYRTDGASLFALSRNISGSIGIAIVVALLARNSQISHADLAGQLTPFSLPTDPTLLQQFGSAGTAALGMLDGMVNREALMIAYLDDFHLLMIAVLCTVPLLLLVKPVRGRASEDATHLALE